MALTPKTRPLHIAQLLLEVHEAQDLAKSLADKQLEASMDLSKAIDVAISVIVIYIKLGREPRVSPKHWEGVDFFRAAYRTALEKEDVLTD
jgi:hypothetical protein